MNTSASSSSVTGDFTLRRATPEDCVLINRLASDVWYHTYLGIHTREQLEYMFEKMYHPDVLARQMKSGQLFFIGYREHAPMGYICIEQQEAHFFYLHKLYVLPAFQGTGAGKFLFEAAVNQITEIHPDKCIMELNVNRQNKAIRFYEKMGMTIVRENDEEIGEGFVMNNCFMRLEIKGNR
ncbi:MAG: GNAT family N-acetyltransferase [Candidatus Azobacteroides sp.]|nr:GNAT family N-acetyltransferase [Candidatus Azobacteroides sp.]